MKISHELNAQSLVSIFETLGQVIRSRDIRECMADPIFVMIYEKIMTLDTEDIDNTKNKWNLMNFYSEAKRIRNPLLFSAFLEKKHKWEEVSEPIKWLFHIVPQPSAELFDSIYMYGNVLQTDKNKLDYGFDDNMPFHDHGLSTIVINHCQRLDSTEKEVLLDAFLKRYAQDCQDNIINLILTYHTQMPALKMITDFFIDNDIDLNRSFPLNRYLPYESKYLGSEKNFFMSSTHTASINNLLRHGFQFDPSYRYHGKDLLNCILETDRKDLIMEIAPYLLIQEPLSDKAIEILNKNKTFSDIYETIKATQMKEKLEHKLDSKSHKSKMKI